MYVFSVAFLNKIIYMSPDCKSIIFMRVYIAIYIASSREPTAGIFHGSHNVDMDNLKVLNYEMHDRDENNVQFAIQPIFDVKPLIKLKLRKDNLTLDWTNWIKITKI